MCVCVFFIYSKTKGTDNECINTYYIYVSIREMGMFVYLLSPHVCTTSQHTGDDYTCIVTYVIQ